MSSGQGKPQTTEETPYALALRLSSEGGTAEEIRSALAERGLTPDEIVVVLMALKRQQDDSARAEAAVEHEPVLQSVAQPDMHDQRISGPDLTIGLGLIAVGVLLFIATKGHLLAYGAIVSGAARLIASFLRPNRLPPQVALAPDDPSPRCADHPDFKSIGTCPRCGAFRCQDCAPAGGFAQAQVCNACNRSSAYLEDKLRVASRRVALALIGPAVGSVVAILVATIWPRTFGGSALDVVLGKLPLLTGLALAAAPFVVLAVVQSAIRHP